MFANFEAFLALTKYETMTAAASHLNVTQSAISKRIAQLEAYMGKKLVERKGNHVQLTAAGQHLGAHLRPMFSELKELLLEEVSESSGHLPIAMTESMLLSWGAKTLYRVQKELPDYVLDLYSDRSTLVVESVRSGESMVAICPGEAENTPDLRAERIGHEEVVLVPAHLKPFRLSSKKQLDVICVHHQHEVSNFIWRAVTRGMKRWGVEVDITRTYNTFAMVTELAVSGFGHGLVPKRLALRMGVPSAKLIEFPEPGVRVPISLVGRPTTLAKPLVRTFKESLMRHLPREFRD